MTSDVASVCRIKGAEPPLAFAPPALKHKGQVFFQTNTLVRYVADQLGMCICVHAYTQSSATTFACVCVYVCALPY